MTNKFWLRCGLVVCGVLLTASAQADFPSVPKETYEALNLDRSASPKQLHEALTKRYRGSRQRRGERAVRPVLGADPNQQVLRSNVVLQATDIGQGYRDTRAVREMPHR